MIKFEVRKRFSSEIAFTADIDCAEDAPNSIKLGLVVKWAVKARANLARANLAGANLAGADLAGANLARADLAGANLARANLARANLAGADLAGANLAGADLAGAYLAGAYLARANLAGANLAGANLAGAYLARADLAGANLARANLIDGGQRSDGYRFVGWIKSGELMILAGCRNLTIREARKHWQETRGGTALGTETMVILDHIEAVAKARGLIAEPASVAA
jgi:hypothetical protein